MTSASDNIQHGILGIAFYHFISLLSEQVSCPQRPSDSRRAPVFVKKSDHIGKLPPSLYKWICNKLNVPQPMGHNWEMLAGNEKR